MCNIAIIWWLSEVKNLEAIARFEKYFSYSLPSTRLEVAAQSAATSNLSLGFNVYFYTGKGVSR
jgi:hypothetical protein